MMALLCGRRNLRSNAIIRCFLILCFVTPAARCAGAVVINETVTVQSYQTFTIPEDTQIRIPGDAPGPGIMMEYAVNAKVEAESGKILTIEIEPNGAIFDNRYGINANNVTNTHINLGKTHITSAATAVKFYGVGGDAWSTAAFGAGSVIKSTHGSAIDASRNVSVNIGDESKIIGNSYGITVGVLQQTDGAVVKAGNNVAISNSSDNNRTNSIAVLSYYSNKGYLEIGDKSKISTAGTGSGNYAVLAGYINASSGAVTLSGDVRIGKSADISTVGGGSQVGQNLGSHALVSVGAGSTITVDDFAKIKTSGEQAAAVRAGGTFKGQSAGGGAVTIGASADISTSGTGSIAVDSMNADSKIYIGKNSTINTAGNLAYGVQASASGTVDIESGANISTNGSNAYGAYATGSGSSIEIGENSIVTTASSHGVYANSGGTVDIGAGARIATLGGASAYGMYANGNNSSLKLGAGSRVSTSAADAIYAQGGSIELEGAYISAADGGKRAIYAAGSLFQQGARVYGEGLFNIIGDMETGNYGTVNLKLTEGSQFTGKVNMQARNNNESISLALHKSKWNITGDSSFTDLALNDSAVNYDERPEGFTTLTVDNLNAANGGAGGNFIMNASIADIASDKLIITGTAHGSHTITVKNSGHGSPCGDEKVTLVETALGQDVDFTLSNVVEFGEWQYLLRHDAGTETSFGEGDAWLLYATGDASNTGSAAINSFAANYLLNYAETLTLIRRLGDLRESRHSSGLWFRAHGGNFESGAKNYVRGFDMDYGGVQIGYDRKYNAGRGGNFYGGVMFGYARGDLSYADGGSGTADSKALGLYGTFIGDDGFYLDAVLKYQWMNNDFEVLDSAGAGVTGSGVSTGGLGASVEMGKRIRLGKGGWFAEPQVQLSYQRQDGGYFTASNEFHIGVEPFRSLTGRVGLLAGYETDRSNFYVKASRVKEFDGDLTIIANRADVIQESFGGSWWVYGIGFTSRINDRNNFYLDFERASGGVFTKNWAVNAGWRMEF